MTEKSSSVFGANFSFHSVVKNISNNKCSSATGKIRSETTHWGKALNEAFAAEKIGLRTCSDEDWNKIFHCTNSSSSISSNSEIMFQQDNDKADDSPYQLSYPGLPAEDASSNKSGAMSRVTCKQSNQLQHTPLVPVAEACAVSNNGCEAFSDLTHSSDSSETQASQASHGRRTSVAVNNAKQIDSSHVYPVRQSRPDCVYYLKTGKCSYGMKCKYNHPPRDKALVTALSRRECFDFLQFGRCPYGRKCKYSHPSRQKAENDCHRSSSVAARTTRDDNTVSRNIGLKNCETRRQHRLSSNADTSGLESNQIFTLWDKTKENRLNDEMDNLTSYHLWDSVPVLDSSLHNRVSETQLYGVDSVNDLQSDESSRCLLTKTCQANYFDKPAVEQLLRFQRQKHVPKQAPGGVSYAENCLKNMEFASQVFSTPSVELSELSMMKLHADKQNLIDDRPQEAQYKKENAHFGEPPSDYCAILSSLFSTCSMQCSESNSVDRVYARKFLD